MRRVDSTEALYLDEIDLRGGEVVIVNRDRGPLKLSQRGLVGLWGVGVCVLFLAQTAPVPSSQDIFAAVKSSNLDLVKLCLQQPGAANLKDSDGMTPLHYAAFKGNLQIAQALLAAGADVNAKDSIGMTPLHAAAFDGRTEMVRLLSEKKGQPNAQDASRMTPLHYAVAAGHVETVKILLEKGADPSLKDLRGRTPTDLALSENRQDLAKLLAAKRQPPEAAAGQTPKATHVYTEEDLVYLRNHGAIVSDEEDSAETKASATSANYTASQVENLEQQISAWTRQKRDLESSLPTLRSACEEARAKAASLQDSKGPTGAYSSQDQQRRSQLANEACYRYDRAQGQIRDYDRQIQYYRKQIDETYQRSR